MTDPEPGAQSNATSTPPDAAVPRSEPAAVPGEAVPEGIETVPVPTGTVLGTEPGQPGGLLSGPVPEALVVQRATIEERREDIRGALAFGLLSLAFLTVGGILYFIAADGDNVLTQSVLPAVVALVGTALGFYFGQESATPTTSSTTTATTTPPTTTTTTTGQG